MRCPFWQWLREVASGVGHIGWHGEGGLSAGPSRAAIWPTLHALVCIVACTAIYAIQVPVMHEASGDSVYKQAPRPYGMYGIWYTFFTHATCVDSHHNIAIQQLRKRMVRPVTAATNKARPHIHTVCKTAVRCSVMAPEPTSQSPTPCQHCTASCSYACKRVPSRHALSGLLAMSASMALQFWSSFRASPVPAGKQGGSRRGTRGSPPLLLYS